jgi:hypothetical protein
MMHWLAGLQHNCQADDMTTIAFDMPVDKVKQMHECDVDGQAESHGLLYIIVFHVPHTLPPTSSVTTTNICFWYTDVSLGCGITKCSEAAHKSLGSCMSRRLRMMCIDYSRHLH